MSKPVITGTLEPEAFVLLAIEKNKAAGKYKGLHTIYSGFNEAFRAYFPTLDPIATTKAMAAAKTIVIIPARGGVTLYLPGDAPVSRQRATAMLNSMGLSAPPAA